MIKKKISEHEYELYVDNGLIGSLINIGKWCFNPNINYSLLITELDLNNILQIIKELTQNENK
jgi:hypothetical protein